MHPSGLFVCVLVVLALGVQAHPHDGYYRHHAIAPRFDVVQSLSEIIDQIADSYMTTATDLEGQVVEVFDPIIPELTKTLDDGNNELAVISDEFDVDFKNSEIGACIDELRESVRAILSNGKEEVAQCVQATRDQVSELRAALEIRVAFIKEQVSAIRNIVSGCKASDEPVKCILQNLKQLLISAGNIVVETILTVIETRHAVRAILAENLRCVGAAVVKAREAVLVARLEAIACVGAAGSSTARSMVV